MFDNRIAAVTLHDPRESATGKDLDTLSATIAKIYNKIYQIVEHDIEIKI